MTVYRRGGLRARASSTQLPAAAGEAQARVLEMIETASSPIQRARRERERVPGPAARRAS
jgi:hypothetical protein